MIFPRIIFLALECYIAFSYIKHFKLKARVMPIAALLIISLIFVLPIVPFFRITLWGLFLFERLWILMTLVLLVEAVINNKNRVLHSIFSVISLAIYFYLRRMI